MEITEKQKQIGIAIGVGVGIVGITAIGYYCFLKPKKLESDNLQEIHKIEQTRLPKLTGDSRWRDIDRQYEDLNNYRAGRDRFTVYSRENSFKDNSSFDGRVQKRFKIIEKEKTVIPRKGRFRTSGERYKHTPSGYYNQNSRRNPNFLDLIIP